MEDGTGRPFTMRSTEPCQTPRTRRQEPRIGRGTCTGFQLPSFRRGSATIARKFKCQRTRSASLSLDRAHSHQRSVIEPAFSGGVPLSSSETWGLNHFRSGRSGDCEGVAIGAERRTQVVNRQEENVRPHDRRIALTHGAGHKTNTCQHARLDWTYSFLNLPIITVPAEWRFPLRPFDLEFRNENYPFPSPAGHLRGCLQPKC